MLRMLVSGLALHNRMKIVVSASAREDHLHGSIVSLYVLTVVLPIIVVGISHSPLSSLLLLIHHYPYAYLLLSVPH